MAVLSSLAGAGRAWLIARGGKLAVMKAKNAKNPLADESATPLLDMDVWEHAYYLDYQNVRQSYPSTFLDKLAN